MANINRRRFLSSGAALGMLGGGGAMGMLANRSAYAADTSGYKALVCLFFNGGLDYSDMILPYDQPSLDLLRSHRANLHAIYDNSDSARTRDALLRLDVANADGFGGREFAFPPEMVEAQALFNAQELAIVGGVGPLIEPTNRSMMENGTAVLPSRLYSHNDQRSTWMAMQVEGAREGWGGRFAATAFESSPSDSAQFVAVTTSSMDVFLASETISQFRMDSNGAPRLTVLQNRSRLGRGDAYDDARTRYEAHLRGRNLSSDNLFMRDVIAVGGAAIDSADTMSAALEAAPEISIEFPDTDIGRQLSVVAQTMAIQQALNVSRQIFYVSIGGFDTHSNQAASLPTRLRNISQSMAAFRMALEEINMWNNAALFTASDFGRTVIDNGDGTDHAWAGHHLVMGGAVQGGRIYGEMADYDIEGERYTNSRGRLIPSVSVEQYAATLGGWFGLDSGELNAALPNLSNFDTPNIGFMG